jgi:hypothetical protein
MNDKGEPTFQSPLPALLVIAAGVTIVIALITIVLVFGLNGDAYDNR